MYSGGPSQAIIENGNLNDTATLENCRPKAGRPTDGPTGNMKVISEDSGSSYAIILIILFVGLLTWLLLLVYFIFYKNIEWSNQDNDIVRVEGGNPVVMSFKYRPSIARFKTFEIKKDNKVLGSNQKQFISCKTVCQFVCYCCLYFFGFFCIEYCINKVKYNNKDKKKHGRSSGNRGGEEYQMMVIERQGPDGAELPAVVIQLPNKDTTTDETAVQQPTAATESEQSSETNPDDEDTELLAQHQATSDVNTEISEEEAKDSNERSDKHSMFTNGRGKIGLTVSNLVISDSGEYNCNIEGNRQPGQGVKNLTVYWIERKNHGYSTEEGINNFEMKCRYGPSDMPLTGYKWKKIKEDGTTEIEDCSQDSRFEVTSYQNSILSLKIKNVILGDAGMYQCEVKPVDGEKILKDTTHLTVKEDVIKMEISDVTIYEGFKSATLLLNIRYVDDSANISKITWCIKYVEGDAKMLLTSPDSRYECEYLDSKNSVCFNINNVEPEDEGEYICEVEVKGRQKIYRCSGRLTVKGPIKMDIPDVITNKGVECDKLLLKLTYFDKSAEISNITWYKQVEGEAKELTSWQSPNPTSVQSPDPTSIQSPDPTSVQSPDPTSVQSPDPTSVQSPDPTSVQSPDPTSVQSPDPTSSQSPEPTSRYEIGFVGQSNVYLNISNVEFEDAGEYICEVKIAGRQKTYSCSGTLTVQDMTLNDCLVTVEDKAVLTCRYQIKNPVKSINWYKKTCGEYKMIFTSDTFNQKIANVPERYKATFKDNETSLEFEQVSVTDAGEYMCKLEIEHCTPMTKLANLSVQFDVFTGVDELGNTYRHPAVVFLNSHLLVFCVKNNSDVIMRRGKMNKKSFIEWEESRVILHEKDTSYHNPVPIVTNNGKVILMCVKNENNTKERKMIRLNSDDNGENWIEACNVENSPGDIQSLGHGVCLDSGKLIIAGVENLDNNERKLFVMTSTDNGDTWDIVYAGENTENCEKSMNSANLLFV
ncbi:uncharacterized protein [Antedon mediterranea]|uniref:uncharacterized protein isoform X2 n=1 Tax=Antedon mediterranea TaxID=105859 RepID=UPI003AF56F70